MGKVRSVRGRLRGRPRFDAQGSGSSEQSHMEEVVRVVVDN